MRAKISIAVLLTCIVSHSNLLAQSANPSTAPVTLTLQDVLQRARRLNPDYQTAVTESKLAKEDKVQSRATLLPNVNYTTSFLYTEGQGFPGVGRFIANNGVHEYIAQGNVHQELSLLNYAEFRRAQAAEALARARADIAARGLVVTVVKSYYGFVAAQRKYATAQRAAAEAQQFYDLSQKLERGGEVAHSDVIKAQIQLQQQTRDLSQAELEMNSTRLEVAVLAFRDFNQNFAVVDDLQTPEPLPAFAEIQTAATKNNPDLRAAFAALQVAKRETTGAWNGFLPSLAFDYWYGIDANQFATEGRIEPLTGFQPRNIGYSAAATLQLPIWNWGSNVSKLKQAHLRQQLANVELSFAQRQLLANLQAFYQEAQTARSQLESLNSSVELAAESLRLTKMRYQAGEATVLEVVDAQNTLTATRIAYDDGQVRYRTALASLQTLTGTL